MQSPEEDALELYDDDVPASETTKVLLDTRIPQALLALV
jgi:hypothetical protein